MSGFKKIELSKNQIHNTLSALHFYIEFNPENLSEQKKGDFYSIIRKLEIGGD